MMNVLYDNNYKNFHLYSAFKVTVGEKKGREKTKRLLKKATVSGVQSGIEINKNSSSSFIFLCEFIPLWMSRMSFSLTGR